MEPVIIPRSDHPISRKSIDPDAVKVLYRLHRAGYQAYLVGGGVRDLLLGRPPKDFDVGTDAHPHQVKRLFRNCRLIGRRFRLAHVHFGGKIVEVSTFRKRSEPEENGAEGEDILIRSDNTFGNAEEDALRRDFTINGLFYDIGTFSVIDYVGGLEDLKARLVRTIGDPDIRFREDPVRMIRAVKFAARLDFSIEADTWQAILDNHEEIMKSAPPRVLEEIYRLLGGGAAEASFRLLHRSGMLQVLIPDVYEAIEEQGGADAAPAPDTVFAWLRALDQARANEEPLTNPILIGSLLAGLAFEGNPPLPAEEEEADGEGGDAALPGERSWYLTGEAEEFVRDVIADLGVPRRDTERLFQVYRALRRFGGQRGRRFSPRGFVTKNYFPEAFLFFRLASTAIGDSGETLTRWRKLAEEAGVDGSIPTGGRRRRRRRRRRGEGFQDGVQEPFEEGLPSEDEAELESLAEEREPAAERPARPHREPHRPHATAGRGPRPPRPEPSIEAQRPARAPAAHGDDEDEDSQIKFLGWSDQPEILRDRPEPPPLVNPYTRQPAGGRARHGGYSRGGGSGGEHRGGRNRDQNGRGGWSGGPRKSSGPQRGPSSGGTGGWGQRSPGGGAPSGGGSAEGARPSGGPRGRRRRRPRRRD
jgi:poly(A) polymerase